MPQVATTVSARDFWGTLGARIGIIRRNYKVAPGLYAVGSPGPQSPVLVTANYKLSFDALRHRLGGIDAWLLVVDTRGINVWCAAGKGSFSTEEVIQSVRRYRCGRTGQPSRTDPAPVGGHRRCRSGSQQGLRFYGPVRTGAVR